MKGFAIKLFSSCFAGLAACFAKDVCGGCTVSFAKGGCADNLVGALPVKNFVSNFENLYVQHGFAALLHAEEDESKTEEATEGRKRKAREEGQIFQTPELAQAFLILGVMGMLILMGRYYFNELSLLIVSVSENPEFVLLDKSSAPKILQVAAWRFMKLFLPIGVMALVVAVMSTLLQTRFYFNLKMLRFDGKRILPSLKNLMQKTIFSRTQAINSAKVFFKISIMILILVNFFLFSFKDFLQLFHQNLYQAMASTGGMITKLMIYLASFMLVLALPDWIVQRAEYLRRIRMTKDEVKRESKDLEGDPQIKARQKERYRALVSRDLVKNVKESDVVVTNPTHYACALKYEQNSMDAPVLQAKGVDAMALRIRQIAEENNIEIIENKPLARGLFAKVEVGSSIPAEFYAVMAEIISKLDKFK